MSHFIDNTLNKIRVNVFSFLLLASSFIVLISPSYTKALDLPYLNDFSSDSLSIDWETYSPYGEWKTESGILLGSELMSPKQIFAYALIGDYNWNNYSFKTDIYGKETVDKIILLYFQPDGSTYAVNMRSSYLSSLGNDVILQKRVGFNGPANAISTYHFENFPNTWYNLKINIFNFDSEVQIDVYVDNNLKIHFVDTVGNFRSGKAGYGVWPQGNAENHFDNLEIRRLTDISTPTPSSSPSIQPTPTILPSPTPEVLLDVPDIKQFATPWASSEYDSAPEWSISPTIERWGCALTSASMVLRYFNHLVDPGSLNTWLKNQIDGYVFGGHINWLVISRFSKQNTQKVDNDKILPSLEYQRNNSASHEQIRSTLFQNIPPVIGVPGHFVVAKGIFGSEVLINDPATFSRITLSQVKNDYGSGNIQSNNFIPSETDLSYIMIVIPKGLELEILNSSKQKAGGLYQESPLVANNNPLDISIVSGGNYQTYLIPKPTSEEYFIKTISGKGKYKILVYMYDLDGNLIDNKINDFDILAVGNSNNLIKVNYDNNPNTNTFDISFLNLLDDLEKIKSLNWINPVYFKSLKTRIMLFKIFSTKNKIFYLHSMKALMKEISKMPQFYLNQDAKEILIRDTSYLISK